MCQAPLHNDIFNEKKGISKMEEKFLLIFAFQPGSQIIIKSTCKQKSNGSFHLYLYTLTRNWLKEF